MGIFDRGRHHRSTPPLSEEESTGQKPVGSVRLATTGYVAMLMFISGIFLVLAMSPTVQQHFLHCSGLSCADGWLGDAYDHFLWAVRILALGLLLSGVMLALIWLTWRANLRRRPRRWLILLFWSWPVVFALFSIQGFGTLAFSPRDPSFNLLQFSTGLIYGSSALAGIGLARRAGRIREANKSIWIAGTQTEREVLVVLLLYIAASSGAGRFNNEFGKLISESMSAGTSFLALGLWFLVVGPGWTSSELARRELRAISVESGLPRSVGSSTRVRGTDGMVLLLLVCLIMDGTLALAFWLLVNLTEPAVSWFVLLGMFVSAIVLIRRMEKLSTVTEAEWPKCTEVSRQLCLLHAVFFVGNMGQLLTPAYTELFATLSGVVGVLFSVAIWVLIFGPDRTSYIETLEKIRERDKISQIQRNGDIPTAT
ncbi:hypothetical protein E3O44_15830 [Cryobacterium algoricola]|uniref:Uncharacterized protein n=1 Tax=Cryobacterium algoricola TaxID=1259183 RepID=A0ABY2I985_9MICO|nr:hypothetical protein [Cryobacterium algoricola]TFB84299.1 hypothetical protein E3O44_15830 [Cryobacterium algoricola]